MANPLVETKAFFDATVPAMVTATQLPAGTTQGTSFPAAAIDKPHIQYAWDGTPTDADNREDTAVRVTVWAPRGRVTDAQDYAAHIRSRFLTWSSSNVWAVERGAGRLPGVDPDTQLPFCTFTVGLVLHAVATT